jgi:type VI secretion system protein ImpB
MAKDGSVAPKERVNIVYKPATGDAQEQIELPLRMLVLGDFTLKDDEDVLEEREAVNIDKDNFNEVLKAKNLSLQYSAPDTLSGEKGGELSVDLKFQHIKDFEPDQVVRQVPELAKIMELRDALMALKGPLGNVPAFRKKIQSIVADPGARERLIKELGLEEK